MFRRQNFYANPTPEVELVANAYQKGLFHYMYRRVVN